MKCPRCGEIMTVTFGDDDPRTDDVTDTETYTCDACGKRGTLVLGRRWTIADVVRAVFRRKRD